MDQKQADELSAKVDAAVNRELDRVLAEVVQARLLTDRKEIDNTVRKLVQERVTMRKNEIINRTETWLDENLGRSIEVAAKAMLDAALAEVRARVLGRR